MPRVLVCGGRKFNDRDMVYEHLDCIHAKTPFSVVIHGDAPGADTLAKEWAISRGIKHLPFPAQWEKYGNAAGPLRNTQMLVDGKPDVVIAFPGGTGTANMVSQARKSGVRTFVYGEVEKTGRLFE